MNILIPIAIIIICLVAFYTFCIKAGEGEEHDELTNRYYRYAKKSDNPKRAVCPKCKQEQAENIHECPDNDHLLRPLIHSTRSDKKYHGVCCSIHGVMWFDKKDL